MKKKSSIISILLLFCLIPSILSIAVNVITSYGYINSTAENEIEDTLQTAGHTLIEAFNAIDSGKFWLSGRLLYKGGVNLTENLSVIDSIKEKTGIECTLFYGDTRYITTVLDENGSRMLLTQCSDEVKEIVLNQGNPYFAKNIDIGGQNYYGYYIPIEQEGKVAGMIFTGKPSASLNTTTREFLLYTLAICGVLLVVIVIIILLLGRIIARHIQVLRDDMVRLSEGNLHFENGHKNRIREIHETAEAAEKLRSQLIEVIQTIQNCSGTVDTSVTRVDSSLGSFAQTVKDLSATMDELAYGAQNMAGSVEKEAFDMNEIAEGISNIAESSQATKAVTESITAVSRTAKNSLDELLQANSYTTESAENVISSISSVNDAVTQITTAAQMIMDISDQTNLLSLNASIEAARAGDAGRGFSVVAGEIQKLAEQSNSSAQQIQSIIEEITNKTEECTRISGQIQEAVGKEAEALLSVNSNFDEVEKNIAEAAAAVNKITEIVSAVEKNKGNVVDSISDLSGISEENAASAEETNASMENLRTNVEGVARETDELKDVIEQLNNSIAFFRL
ncbi:MAG: methyl-accepting chemotaxis protein [Blautia sp.]|nr:methyl-accepting chemotaxis protein [Blautia sp.]MCM1200122.1 methyl-accepting chemotaxis protein [Bacteroides fragilis]